MLYTLGLAAIQIPTATTNSPVEEVSARVVPSDKRRVMQLDLLRGLAILLVIGRQIAVSPQEQGVFQPVAAAWFRFGWTGVDLFFVLSGFLVGGLLFKELRETARLNVRRFLIRRGFKIWPAYFIYLSVLFCLQTLHIIHDAPHLLPNVLHIQNYLGTSRVHTWSLAVEEHFYLILPLLLLWLTSRKRGVTGVTAVPLVCSAGIVLCTAMRFANLHHPFSAWTHTYPTHLRMDGLLFGVLIAYLYHFKKEWLDRIGRQYFVFFFLGIALVSPMMFLPAEHPFVFTIGFTLLYLGFGCILIALLYAPVHSAKFTWFLASRPTRLLSFVGFYSYSIYLWHIDLALKPLDIFWTRGPTSSIPISAHWIIDVLIGVPLACGVGIVLSKLIEMPALAVRDRLFSSRTTAPTSAMPSPQEVSSA